MTAHRALPTVVIVGLVTVALSSVVVTVVGLRREPTPVADPAPPVATRPEVAAAEVLAAWDAERAEAWATGDVRRLRALYTPGSVAGHRDATRLRRWLDRGLVVTGLHTQVLSLQEVARAPGRLVLSVTDRIVGGVALGTGSRSPLPVDRSTTRTITLVRQHDAWAVAAVRPG